MDPIHSSRPDDTIARGIITPLTVLGGSFYTIDMLPAAWQKTLFAKLARDGALKYGQMGARYWLKKARFALDFSLQQQRSAGQRASGFLIGFGRYDL